MFMLKYLEKHRIIPLIMTILLAIEVFYVSSISSFPGPPVKGINFAIVYHIIVFFLLTFFLLITIKGEEKLKPKHILWTLVLVILYAISDEFHQSFVPGRDSSIKDVLIDLIGILFAVLIYPKKNNKKERKVKNNKSKYKKPKTSKLLQE
jgi:VanZ family protein